MNLLSFYPSRLQCYASASSSFLPARPTFRLLAALMCFFTSRSARNFSAFLSMTGSVGSPASTSSFSSSPPVSSSASTRQFSSSRLKIGPCSDASVTASLSAAAKARLRSRAPMTGDTSGDDAAVPSSPGSTPLPLSSTCPPSTLSENGSDW
eukprot:scaffold11434_cov127-Isochrysis_galbana.AAC.15